MKKGLLLLFVGITLLCNAQTDSIVHDGIYRNYILHLPASYNPSYFHPLVINMHGLGSNAAQQQFYSAMDAVADTANFIVVYPNGMPADTVVSDGKQWNVGQNIPFHSGVDDVGFISSLLDSLISFYSIDTTRIYSTGMSMGGFMSYRLACELEHRIAAIASVTGVMLDSLPHYCQSHQPIPVLQMHGTSDSIVPYNGLAGLVSVDNTISHWIQHNNCPTTPTTTTFPDIFANDNSTVDKFHYGPGDDSSEVVLYKVTNGGHSWPGGFPVPNLGNTNMDINATHEIWHFFRNHQLNYSPTAVINTIINEINFSIYPNPFINQITISFKEKYSAQIALYNSIGMKLKEVVVYNTNTFQLETGNIKKGAYFLKIRKGNNLYYKQVIKL